MYIFFIVYSFTDKHLSWSHFLVSGKTESLNIDCVYLCNRIETLSKCPGVLQMGHIISIYILFLTF